MGPARRRPTRPANCPGRRRLPRRDDRPFCSRGAPPVVWLRVSGMTNLFSDFRRLVVLPALEKLVENGSLPKGLDLTRVAVEPPRDPSHGDLATNAAMVLAGAVKEPPLVLAARIVTALERRGRV